MRTSSSVITCANICDTKVNEPFLHSYHPWNEQRCHQSWIQTKRVQSNSVESIWHTRREKSVPFKLLALLFYQRLYPLKYFGKMWKFARDFLCFLCPAFDDIFRGSRRKSRITWPTCFGSNCSLASPSGPFVPLASRWQCRCLHWRAERRLSQGLWCVKAVGRGCADALLNTRKRRKSAPAAASQALFKRSGFEITRLVLPPKRPISTTIYF